MLGQQTYTAGAQHAFAAAAAAARELSHWPPLLHPPHQKETRLHLAKCSHLPCSVCLSPLSTPRSLPIGMGPVPTVLCGLQNAPQAGFPEILPPTERLVGLNEIMGIKCFEELRGLIVRRD